MRGSPTHPPLNRSVALGVLISLMALLGVTGRGAALALVPLGQGGEDAATPIGLPRVGDVAFEVIGRNDRGNQDIVVTGYLTAIVGADDELLFTRTDRRTEETARFTFVAELTPVASSQVEAVRVETAVGSMTIFFQAEPAADFEDAASFGDGEPIASFEARTQDILYDQSVSSTLAVTTGDLLQTEAMPFAHEGVTFRFGLVDGRFHLDLTGADTRGRSGPNRTVYVEAGYATLTQGSQGEGGVGDEATPEDQATPDEEETPDGEADGDEEVTPGAAGDDCAAIAPWYEATSAQVADIEVLAEFILDVESVDDLDADQLRAAADALGVLADQGREATLPAEAAEVNAAIADATEAIGAAVEVIATAVDGGSEDDLDAGQEDLAVALEDLQTAIAAAEEIAAPCEEG